MTEWYDNELLWLIPIGLCLIIIIYLLYHLFKDVESYD